MSMRKGGAVLAAILSTAFLGLAAAAPAGPPSEKKRCPAPSISLRQHDLRGGMQGFCGAVLDVNGDGQDDLVVGAPYARIRNSLGVLLIYHGTRKGFGRRPALVLRGDGNLGWSLAGLGDVTGAGGQWFAAGAHSGSGDHASLCGTVSVYQGGLKRSVLEGENALDKFGYALAAGDINDDGVVDLMVGAPLHSPDPSHYQQGAVYIYFGPDFGRDWDIKIPANDSYAGLGFALATGDINADGVADLLMGAGASVIGYYGGKNPAVTMAAAEPDLTLNSRDRGFGRSLAVLWDIDGDGFNEMAVGAYQAEIGNTDSGRLFIVRGGAGPRTVDLDADPAPTQVLARIDGEATGGQFASAVVPIGDIDGDHVPDLAVSAVHADGDTWPMTGGIFVFSGAGLTDGPLVQNARFLAGHAQDMHLGTFLTQVGGGRWLAAGAPTESVNTGGVYLFELGRSGSDHSSAKHARRRGHE